MPSPFFGTTPRYALRKLLGTSNISDIDSGFDALATDVENAFAGYKSGTSAARLAATNIDGLLWRETDTGLLYLGTGTTWINVGVPGAWVALTLATNINTSAGFGIGAPSARLVGDRVWLKGTIHNNTGGVVALGTTVATLPSSAMFPSGKIQLPSATNVSGGTQLNGLQIDTAGHLSFFWNWAAGDVAGLDGLSFSLT